MAKYLVTYQATGHVFVTVDEGNENESPEEIAADLAQYEAEYSPNFDTFYIDDVALVGE